MANGQKDRDDGWFSWALVVFLFIIKAWPVALLLLFSKLFVSDERDRRETPPPLQTEYRWQAASGKTEGRGTGHKAASAANRTGTNKARSVVKKATRSPVAKKSTAWLLKIAGAAFMLCGVMMTGGALAEMLYLLSDVRWWLPELLQALAFLTAGGGMLCSGFSMDKHLKRYAKYLSIMGDREAVPVEELARTLGYPEKRVQKDLRRMIDKGYFGGKAYLNVELGYLFRSGQADAAWKRQQAEAQAAKAPPTPKEAEEGYSGILRNIRRANDRIADPVLSAKIDRLEEITARIFRVVEEDPQKRDKIDTFLNYYLPTTQKLLDSYAEFESAGVEGENLRQAKARIESTMDAIVKGFEHQLDELYKADAMDVDSDIRVMEHMLRRDTATTADDFGLGGSTAVEEQRD